MTTSQPVGLSGAEPSSPCLSLSLLAAWQDVVKAKPAEMESTEMLSGKGWGYPGETFHVCEMGRRFWRLISHKSRARIPQALSAPQVMAV